jgi:hypothetical protein
MKPLADAITERLRITGSVSGPRSHGERLASSLLPDVIRYNPDRAAGFTFAAQNGRHPSEQTDEVVSATLKVGSPVAGRLAPRYHSVGEFPYFERIASGVRAPADLRIIL